MKLYQTVSTSYLWNEFWDCRWQWSKALLLLLFFFTRRGYSFTLNVIKVSVFNAFRSLSKALFTHNFLSCTILSGEFTRLIYAHYVTLMVFLIGKIARMCGY